MPVAKTYQSFKIISPAPYEVNGRYYVIVCNPKTNAERQVRWYSNREYEKMYGEPAPNSKDEKTQKEALGFAAGPITIFKGDTYSHLAWFKESPARYCRWWGWYLPAGSAIPEDLPIDLTPISLSWELVGKDNGNLKTDTEIENNIDSLLYEESPSNYVGNIGERITVEVVIKRIIELQGMYGDSYRHIMEDNIGNVYVWTTSSARWSENSIKKIRGTIKDHKTYKNCKQTVLNRCVECK